MGPADLAELGSRIQENVRALERRKNPMFVLTYRGVPVPSLALRISTGRVQPGAPVFRVICEADLGVAGERLSKGDLIVLGKDGLIYRAQGRSI